MKYLITNIVFIFILNLVFAWDNHSMMTYEAVKEMPEVKNLPPVRVESLEDFVMKEQKGLISVLQNEEHWAKAYYKDFPSLPVGLEFKGGQDPKQVKEAFLHAIRVNPDPSYYETYVQEIFQIPSDHHPGFHGLEPFFEEMKGTITETIPQLPADKLEVGETIAPLLVLSSGSKEPDYGFDVHLWENNGTSYGQAYHWGLQPFGDPHVLYSSQAPFHMGFFHQSPIIYLLAPSIQHTYPEYRTHLYLNLSLYAFQTGHPYWGWRFLGWALHYIQDLTNPYHASIAPGFSTTGMILEDAKMTLGLPSSLISLSATRHDVLEKYVLFKVQKELTNAEDSPVLLSALHDTKHDQQLSDYSENEIRDVISKNAYDIGPEVDRVLLESFPAKYVNNPEYVSGITEPYPDYAEMSQNLSKEKKDQLESIVSDRLRDYGSFTRQAVRYVLQKVD